MPTADVAVLIATKDGAQSVGDTIASARAGGDVDVYVVSDGSTDDTAEVARAAGARVLELPENVGKPGAIFRGLFVFQLTHRYEAVAILDDDTLVAPDFLTEAKAKMTDGVAIVVGQTQSRPEPTAAWNPWLASRAYTYWRYQVTLRRGQSAFNAINCISGSNSVYRSAVLDQVVTPNTPYIVDDTYWTLETHRRKLGRIVYAPEAKAWVQDPTNFRDWYKQNLRWLWGTFQGIRGHRVGRKLTALDFFYVLLMLDWAGYVLGAPFAFGALGLHFLGKTGVMAWYFGGYIAWAVAASIATKRWRLLPLAPAIIVIDWIYRLVFLHALVKTIRQPTVESCRWTSPTRYEAREDAAA